MNNCCAERQTPYCPICGRCLVQDGSLGGLLKHIRSRIGYYERSLARQIKVVAALKAEHKETAHGKWCVKTKDRTRAFLSKWSAWSDNLVEALVVLEHKEESDGQ